MSEACRRDRDQRGNAAVEFALVMVPLMVLLFGMVQYGIYFWALQGGSDIARSAARMAAVGSPSDCASFKSAVLSQVNGLTGTGSSATIQRTYSEQNPGSVTVGDMVTVTVSFTSPDLHFPLIPFIHNGVVTTSAQSRVDFVPAPLQACP
jgi:Flp pilus assembly protein TadG